MINTEKHAQDSGDNAQRSDATNAATNSRYPLTLAFRSQPKNNSSSRNYKQNINAILFAYRYLNFITLPYFAVQHKHYTF